MSEQPPPMDWEAYAKSLEVDAGLAVAQWEAEKEAHFATAQERDRLQVLLRRAWNEVADIALANEIDAVLAEQEKEQP